MPLPTKLMTIGAKGAKTGAKAATKTDQEALVDAAKAADRAAAGKRAADVAKATAPMKMSEALGNLNVEGKGKLKVTQSDRTRVGGGNIGGAMFPGLSQVDPFYEGLVWGVGKKGTASSLINQSDPNTIWTTILGKEDQLKSNPLVFNRLYDAFKREAKAGLLDDELRQKINAGLEPEFGVGADILDPKLRQKINTFDKRVLVADLLLGKGIGGEQRGGSIIPGSAILRQETEPLLLHTKQGGDVPTFAVGPRLFSLSGEVKERPDLHPGFPYLLTGEDTGMVFKPVPGEEAMIDFMTRMQEAGKKPGYYEWTMGEAGRGLPSQDINEAYLTYLQKKGYAEGGDVGSPGGIPEIAQELEAELRQYQVGGAIRRAASAASKGAKKSIPPTFGGSYDNLVLRKAKEEFATTYGMDVGQGLSKDYDFVDINRITPSEKVNEDHVKELMSALKNEDPFNTKVPPVIIDSEGNVLDGHHRVEAAKRLGIKSVPAIEKFEIKNGTKIIDTTEEHKAIGGQVQSRACNDFDKQMNLEAQYQAFKSGGLAGHAAGGAAKMKLRKKADQPIEEISTPRPQLPQFGAGAPQEPSFTPEDPVQQMTVGSTNIPGQAGKFSKEDLVDAFERFKVLGGDYLRRGGPRGLPIDLALHLFGGKLPADVRELFGEGVPPESSFNPDELIEIEQKAHGGPVHMQVGGQPPMDEIGYMMEAVDPTKESKGSPTFEAVKFMAPQVAKSLVSPFVGIYGTLTSGKYGTPEGIRAGEEAIERFMMPGEVNLSPEAQEKIEDFENLMGKIETTGKLPPMMPELFGPVTGAMQGMGTQARSLAGQAAKRVSQAVDEVPSLPVGLSIEPVGKPISEVIKPGKVKVEADDLGFYSPIEKALANSPRKQGTGQAFINDITKFSPSKGELEATGIFDWLRDQKSVTKQDVLNYLDQNRVQIDEVVRGTILDETERQKLNDINRRISQGYGHLITPEEEQWFEATRARMAEFKDPRFEQEKLILPGGKNYREILLKFPMKQNAPVSTEKSAATMLFENNMKEKYGGETFPSIYNRLTPDEIEKYDMYVREDINARKTESILQDKRNNFRTNHWPDDPNTLAHMRMQDMTLGGKKTLVVEEIQSDWHQQGREKGYQRSKDLTPDEIDLRFVESEVPEGQDPSLYPGYYEAFDKSTGEFLGRHSGTLSRDQAMRDAVMSANQFQTGVPDAPFKKDWYQLAIKRLMKYAADNDYDQVALVGPEEQIRRGSLSTYIDGLYYKKNPDGSIKLEAEKGGSVVLDKTVDPKDLELYVNKDVAEKILNSKEGDGTLTGDDLEIGGEGMRQYYDRNYPDSMNRIGKKYGAKVNKTNFVLKEFEPDDVEEVYTGEFDRYGREIMAYKVVDRETGKEIAFEYDFDKVLDEANKKAPSTSMWVMDLPATLKSDVKVGQPYKKGGAVKKRNGGPIAAPFNTVPDRTDAGQILDFGLQQELNRYA